MKRFIVFSIVLLMLCSCISYAESSIDLSALSPEELQKLISTAESQLQLNDETMLHSAIEALIKHWKNEIYADPFLDESNGYFEILSVQASYIKKEFATQDEFASSSDAMFEDVYCVVDFVILSDYFGSDPYYWDAGVDNCVVIYRDGTAEVLRQSLFNIYRARTYSNDFSEIIERVERFDLDDDSIYYLAAE